MREPAEPGPLYCPVCDGYGPETLYEKDGEIIGCDLCIRQVDAGDYLAEHSEPFVPFAVYDPEI